ncbi:MAG: hypothetical protein WCD53_05075 [Microcoleus sp.]
MNTTTIAPRLTCQAIEHSRRSSIQGDRAFKAQVYLVSSNRRGNCPLGNYNQK